MTFLQSCLAVWWLYHANNIAKRDMPTVLFSDKCGLQFVVDFTVFHLGNAIDKS